MISCSRTLQHLFDSDLQGGHLIRFLALGAYNFIREQLNFTIQTFTIDYIQLCYSPDEHSMFGCVIACQHSVQKSPSV